MEEFKNLKRVALNELRMLDEQYASKDQFSDVDAKKYDILTHALKCHLTACAILKAEEEHDEYGLSGRRGRNMNNGQYISRDEADRSYSDGFQDGMNAANNGQSGHYPMYPRYPYRERNW